MGLVEELEKLADLHRAGAITDDEYGAAKARVLGDGGDSPPSQRPRNEAAPAKAAQGAIAPGWMTPWGWFLVWIGALGFGASAYINWRPDHEVSALIAGLLNPMFFIGMPIGLYWLVRSGITVGGVLTAIDNSTLTEKERRERGLK